MSRRTPAVTGWLTVALLAAILAVLGCGAGFLLWQWRRGDELQRDRARVEQLDAQIRLGMLADDRGERARVVNALLAEQNALVRKWPELGRVEQTPLKD